VKANYQEEGEVLPDADMELRLTLSPQWMAFRCYGRQQQQHQKK